jgi:TRAP-type C4-dicarboxylate transport system substrate-binding protein
MGRQIVRSPRTAALALASGVAVAFVSACGSTSSGSSSPGSTTTYTIKVDMLQAPGTDAYKVFQTFADKAAKDSNNRLIFKLYPNSVLGAQSEVIGELQQNTIQMSDLTYTAADTIVPDVDLMSLPGLWKSPDQLNRAFDGGALGNYINTELEAKGIIGAGAASAGSMDFVTKTPVNSLGDLKGLKIRVLTGPYPALASKLLGMVPITVSISDVPTSLGTGLINSMAYNSAVLQSTKLWSFFKYVTQANFYQGVYGILVSDTFYKSLPADLQKIILQDGYSTSIAWTANEVPTEYAAAGPALQGEGLTVTQFTADEQAQFDQLIDGPELDLWKKNNGTTALALAQAQT